jgi:hypothetical protein
MRPFQFWILLLGSFLVSALLFKQILLQRDLGKKRQELADYQEVANTGAAFENAWKQIAMRIFQDSRQDQALSDLLKRDGVLVRANTNADGGNPPATAPPLPMVPPKVSTPMSHPANH